MSSNLNSRITTTLTAGTYTVEATTFDPAITGEFTLATTAETSSETPTPPPAGPAPEPAPSDDFLVDMGTLTGDVFTIVRDAPSVSLHFHDYCSTTHEIHEVRSEGSTACILHSER